jgi:hypothetical protein
MLSSALSTGGRLTSGVLGRRRGIASHVRVGGLIGLLVAFWLASAGAAEGARWALQALPPGTDPVVGCVLLVVDRVHRGRRKLGGALERQQLDRRERPRAFGGAWRGLDQCVLHITSLLRRGRRLGRGALERLELVAHADAREDQGPGLGVLHVTAFVRGGRRSRELRTDRAVERIQVVGPSEPGACGNPSVSCTSSSACVGVGFGAMPFNMYSAVWNGLSWSINIGPRFADGNFIQAVSCSSAVACMAIGPNFDFFGGGDSVPGPPIALAHARGGALPWAETTTNRPASLKLPSQSDTQGCAGPGGAGSGWLDRLWFGRWLKSW